MQFTTKAINQLEEYSNKPHFLGFRKEAFFENDRSELKADGFVEPLIENKHNHSRTYKAKNHPKTPGRNPDWMDVVEVDELTFEKGIVTKLASEIYQN